MSTPWATTDSCAVEKNSIHPHTPTHKSRLHWTTPFESEYTTHLVVSLCLPRPGVTTSHPLCPVQSCVCELKHDVLLLVYGPFWPTTKFRYFPEATRPFTHFSSRPRIMLAVKVLQLNKHLLLNFINIIIVISVMELGHLLTRSGLTYPEVSSKFYHDSFCQLGSSVPLFHLFH